MRHIKIGILLIPVAIILFLIYANLIKSYDFNYFYDIGAQQDQISPYLTPAERVSATDNNQTRNITRSLTYFKVNIPKGSSILKAEIRFKEKDGNGKIFLGMQDKPEWSYQNRLIYDETLQKLSRHQQLVSSSYNVYKLNTRDVPLEEGRMMSDLLIEKSYPLESFENYSHIDFGLRGGHRFYVYLDGNLRLDVTKQDINWYDGHDNLVISLHDMKGNKIAETRIEDDGYNTSNHMTDRVQYGHLEADGLTDGTYELRFSDFDGIIRDIRLNTNKIITRKLFLADDDMYIPKSYKESEIFFSAKESARLDFVTYHDNRLQDIKAGKGEIRLGKRAEAYLLETNEPSGKIELEHNDVIITSRRGFLSFSDSMFFSPFYEADPLNLSRLDEYDYAVMPKSDYMPARDDGGWIISQATFNLSQGFIKNSQLSMMITIPNLQKDTNSPVTIDWINITVHKDGILQG